MCSSLLLQTASVFSACWGGHRRALGQDEPGAAAAGVEQPPGQLRGRAARFPGKTQQGRWQGLLSHRSLASAGGELP